MTFNRKEYNRIYQKEVRESNKEILDMDDFPEECYDYVDEILVKNYEFAEDLIICLNKWKNISDVTVNLYCKSRPISKSEMETFGDYIPSSRGKPATINIWTLTQTEQLAGPEKIIRTIVEEWMHHYDFKYLKMTMSPHCDGFKDRINQLMKTFAVRSY